MASGSYLTPASFGEAEIVEKKSRFIARVWPCETETEAISHIEEMRKKHYDARHNVYAYIIRENSIMRYSDDGEPSGTSGQPVLNVFRSQGIENMCCVVTRYFGGTLLGTGGLVRAYSAAAKSGLESAGILKMDTWVNFSINCPYSSYETIVALLQSSGALIENTEYAADVCIKALVTEAYRDEFSKLITEKTNGRIVPHFGDTCFKGVAI